VLVLGAGGILGEAWMNGVLAGLEGEDDGFDSRGCRGYLGTSAGSIVATALAAGVSPGSTLAGVRPPSGSGSTLAGVRPPSGLPEQPAVDDVGDEAPPGGVRRLLGAAAAFGSTAAAPLASLALGSTAAGGAVVRRAALARVPPGRRSLADLGRTIERLGVQWDGRLRIAAVELETGRRVVLGAPGAPDLPVSEAVQASCAIPGVFRPVRFGDRSYVDGGAWSPTNMDAAHVERGDHVLCLNPTGSMRPALANPVGAIGPLSRSVAAAEALVLRRRGASVTTVNPDRESAAAMGTNLMRSGPHAAVTAAGLAQGRRLARSRNRVHA
jgi:NTE family protein